MGQPGSGVGRRGQAWATVEPGTIHRVLHAIMLFLFRSRRSVGSDGNRARNDPPDLAGHPSHPPHPVPVEAAAGAIRPRGAWVVTIRIETK